MRHFVGKQLLNKLHCVIGFSSEVIVSSRSEFTSSISCNNILPETFHFNLGLEQVFRSRDFITLKCSLSRMFAMDDPTILTNYSSCHTPHTTCLHLPACLLPPLNLCIEHQANSEGEVKAVGSYSDRCGSICRR